MIENEHIVIFSSDDWDSGLKTSKYHLAVRLARTNDVLFVNSIGLRSPQLSSGRDLGRMWGKLAAFVRGAERVGDRLHVLTPVVVPYRRWAFVRALNRRLLLANLRRAVRRLGLGDPILLIFSPNVADVVGRLGERLAVYYCIDELTGYREVDSTALAASETELMNMVDCVIACSQALADRRSEEHPHTYYVPHGVDWESFSRVVTDHLEVPADLAALPGPVIGFFGFLSDDWIDFELVDHLARSHPEWSIVLIGRVKGDLRSLVTATNVHYLGMRRFEDLPAYCAGFDVGIVPFALNELTRHSSPLKLLEYLAAGLPVVSVDIPEVHRYREFVAIASDRDDFVRHVERALADDTTERQVQRSDRMRVETWEYRLEQIGEILEERRRGRAGAS